ncbi:MAG: hypothetical protein REJ24_09650 [Rhodocyclaceae bacterium]|nr:hypothetical protein [Rhodocyclaceae bacterium]
MEDAPARLHERKARGIEQPVLDEACNERMQALRRRGRRNRQAQPAALRGQSQRLLEVLDAGTPTCQMALLHGRHLLRVFDLVRSDLEHAPHLRVGGDEPQGRDHALLQHGERIVLRAVGRHAHAVLHGQGHALHHGVEQVGLVLEVPVDGAARGAGLLRDLLQRGLRDALRLKQDLGSIQQAMPGGEGLFLGATNHDVSWGCERRNARS